MPIKIDIDATLTRRNSEPLPLDSFDTFEPSVVHGDRSKLSNLADKASSEAGRCIYCGSRVDLSNEHIIPYALGGDLQILRGSCEVCRKKTSAFENLSLNGSMANVRMLRGIKSRSNHGNAETSINVLLVKQGKEVVETFDIRAVPVLFGLPLFQMPALLRGSRDTSLPLVGWVPMSFGPDPEEFLRGHGATVLRQQEHKRDPLAFAQMIAKVAYAYAASEGVLEFVPDANRLPVAFLDNPETLGLFVGMMPGPFELYPGIAMRLTFRWEPGFVCLDVQLFSDVPGPTYVVVLGECKTLRNWRNIRSRISLNAKSL